MNKLLKKSYLLIILSFIITFSLVGCMANKEKKDQQKGPIIKSEVDINEKNAKALKIGNPEKSELIDGKSSVVTKVQNTSNFNVSNIYIKYSEFDKNNNFICKSKSFLDITLSPGEIAYVEMTHEKYADSLVITGYKYRVENKSVTVDQKNDTVDIENKDIDIDNSKTYEALAISDVKEVNESKEGNAYTVKIKNLLPKDLGNIVLKVAEQNEDGEYTMINHIPYNNVLRPSEEADIDIISSKEAKRLEIVGYSYDNPEEKIKVSIDLKSNQVEINK